MKRVIFLAAVGCISALGSAAHAQQANPLSTLMGAAQQVIQQAQPTAAAPAQPAQAQGILKAASFTYWLENGGKTTCLAVDIDDNALLNALEPFVGKAVIATGPLVKGGNDSCLQIGLSNLPRLANGTSASAPPTRNDPPAPKIAAAPGGTAATSPVSTAASDAPPSSPKAAAPGAVATGGQQAGTDTGDDLLVVSLHPSIYVTKPNYLKSLNFDDYNRTRVCIAENKQDATDSTFRMAKWYFALRSTARDFLGGYDYDFCEPDIRMSTAEYALIRRKFLKQPDGEVSTALAKLVNSTERQHPLVAYTIPAREVAEAKASGTKAGIGFIIRPFTKRDNKAAICQLDNNVAKATFPSPFLSTLREKYYGAIGREDPPFVDVPSADAAVDKLASGDCTVFAGNQDQVDAVKTKLDSRNLTSLISTLWGEEQKGVAAGIVIEVTDLTPADDDRCVVGLKITNRTSANYRDFLLRLRTLDANGKEIMWRWGNSGYSADQNEYIAEYRVDTPAGASVKYVSEGSGFGKGFAAPCKMIAALKLRAVFGGIKGGKDITLRDNKDLFVMGPGRLPIVVRDIE